MLCKAHRQARPTAETCAFGSVREDTCDSKCKSVTGIRLKTTTDTVRSIVAVLRANYCCLFLGICITIDVVIHIVKCSEATSLFYH